VRLYLNGGVALHATSSSYLRLWVTGAWRTEQFGPRKYAPTDSIVAIPDSMYGTVGMGIDYGHPDYHVLRHFNTYARREDVNVSRFLRVGLWAAPQAFGYPEARAGVGAEFSGGVSSGWSGGFVSLRLRTNGVFTSTELDSARIRGGVTLASQNIADQTIILHFEAGALRRPRPGAEYDPWEDQTGPRLFPAHAVTGDRTMWFAFEDRILVADEAWGLIGVGLAPFFDWGGAWYDGKEMRVGGNVGISARLGPTRAVRGEVTEFAFGYRYGVDIAGVPIDGFAVTIRRGIVF
jgi:hypothetical protein